MKIALILFSVFLFATEAHIKNVPKSHRIYIYIKSKQAPKQYHFPNIAINNGELNFLGEFNYFHNGYYYVGRKYEVNFKNILEIKPLKIQYNSKTYKTNPLHYQKHPNTDINIQIKTKPQKSNLFNILIVSIIIYLVALIVIYKIKVYKLKEKLGYFEDDIKKFYYFLATNNYKEVEVLNKNKNVFKKPFKYYQSLFLGVIWKEVGFAKFVKEFMLFFAILIVLLILKAFV